MYQLILPKALWKKGEGEATASLLSSSGKRTPVKVKLSSDDIGVWLEVDIEAALPVIVEPEKRKRSPWSKSLAVQEAILPADLVVLDKLLAEFTYEDVAAMLKTSSTSVRRIVDKRLKTQDRAFLEQLRSLG